MNAPADPTAQPERRNSTARRFAAAVGLSVLVFVALWLAAFTWLTSLLIASGCCVAFVAAGTVIEVVAAILDVIATVILVILAAIAAIFAAIFSLFG